MNEQMRAYLADWVAYAERDLGSAERQLEIEAWDVCCVLCEQAVEKYLKALYVLRNEAEPPRTHKIVELAHDLGAPPELYERLHILETDYIRTRYPVPLGDPGAPPSYDEDTARNRLSRTRDMVAWVKNRLADEEAQHEADT